MNVHRPVLLKEVLESLRPQRGESYLDVTAGFGGHAKAILARTGSPQKAMLVDRDLEAVKALRKLFGPAGATIIHQDFWSASRQLLEQSRNFDLILADLGTSSPQLDSAERGFAIQKSGPLDMRMDLSQQLTAEAILNSYSEKQLTELLETYGEEPKARAIARRLVAARPLRTTDQLAAIVAKAATWRSRSRVHPATRTFQALRVAVNQELEQLEKSLPLWLRLLAPKGRLVVISFHSLEDRLVKRFLVEQAGETYNSELVLLNKKPLQATKQEIVFNPRARSAKLRAAAKIKTKTERNKGKLNAY